MPAASARRQLPDLAGQQAEDFDGELQGRFGIQGCCGDGWGEGFVFIQPAAEPVVEVFAVAGREGGICCELAVAEGTGEGGLPALVRSGHDENPLAAFHAEVVGDHRGALRDQLAGQGQVEGGRFRPGPAGLAFRRVR